MKTFKLIIFAFFLFSIFSILPVVAETTPMTALTPAEKIYPPFLIFDEGGEIAICTTSEGIKDDMEFGTKYGTYEVRGDSVYGPNGEYNISSSDISSPSGKTYQWDNDEVGEYTIWSNEISGSTGTYILDNTGIL